MTRQTAQTQPVLRLARRARARCRRGWWTSRRVKELELALAGARMGGFEWEFATGRARLSPEMETLHGFAPGGFAGTWQALQELVRTGLIRELPLYVLDSALEQCRTWRRHGLDLSVAVNVTGRDLLDLGFPDQVAALLTKWGSTRSRSSSRSPRTRS